MEGLMTKLVANPQFQNDHKLNEQIEKIQNVGAF
jgi:hypothetical protein